MTPAAKPVKRKMLSSSARSGFSAKRRKLPLDTSGRDLLSQVPPGSAVAFTDGACRGNPGATGSGAVLKYSGVTSSAFEAVSARATCNIGELRELALDLAQAADIPKGVRLYIFTDSKYCWGALTQGYKRKKNIELLRAVDRCLELWKVTSGATAQLQWIAGHCDIGDNEEADRLARLGATYAERGDTGVYLAGPSGRVWEKVNGPDLALALALPRPPRVTNIVSPPLPSHFGPPVNVLLRPTSLESAVDLSKCILCKVGIRGPLFSPCGHLICCLECAEAVQSAGGGKCPHKTCCVKITNLVYQVLLE